MKKIINESNKVVEELISGLVLSHNQLSRIEGYSVVIRSDAATFRQSGKVALISGGGSGHEPSHAGFVGQGMLSAAVLGDVFTSPSPQQVYQAIMNVTGPAGALLIVKNYTGDRLNFGLAQEMARSQGLKVELVIVADDVALEDSKRGLAGTVLVHKLVGALAEQGASLQEVKSLAERIIANVRTMGVGLGPCTIPAAGKPNFELGESEIELGLGIHGEPGILKQPLVSANDLVDTMLTYLLKNLADSAGKQLAVLINGLGGTPLMELYIVSQRVHSALSELGFNIKRTVVGTLMSSLEMPGMSITLLTGLDDELAHLLDAPTHAPAWPVSIPKRTDLHSIVSVVEHTVAESDLASKSNNLSPALIEVVKRVCAELINKADYLTELDRAVGDGDLGISMERGAKAVLQRIEEFSKASVADFIHSLAMCLQEYLGGTSGPLYAIFFLKVSATLKQVDPVLPALAQWALAVRDGVEGISHLGGATRGDRTMLDALFPVVDVLTGAAETTEQALEQASKAASEGANATAEMVSKKGRSQYLGDRVLHHKDGGAEAVAVILAVVSQYFQQQ